MIRRPCPCGGEVMLDSFDPIRRPIEWFMRCLSCDAMSAPCASAADAEAAWAAESPPAVAPAQAAA